MDPFQRLRETIDRAHAGYLFNQDPQFSNKLSYVDALKGTYTSEDFNKMKQIFLKEQQNSSSQIKKLNQQVTRVSKLLKRNQLSNQSLISQVVSLQKENQQLNRIIVKKNQHSTLTEERQRKYKQQICRVNKTIEDLAKQLQNQRNYRKNTNKEYQQKVMKQAQQIRILNENVLMKEKELAKLQGQIKQRINMFEYNIRSNSQERIVAQNNLAKTVANYQNIMKQIKQNYQTLKISFNANEKQFQVLKYKYNFTEQSLLKQTNKIKILSQENDKMQQQLKQTQDKLKETNALFFKLQEQKNNLEQQLSFQKKRQKIKVVEVQDQAILLQLQMYRKQCKQLMLEKSTNSLSSRVQSQLNLNKYTLQS